MGSWTDDDIIAVEGYLEDVKEYIDTRKCDALLHLDFLMDLQEKLEKKYTPTYNMVFQDIMRDDPVYAAAVALFADVEFAMEGMCQNRNSLPTLYTDGKDVKLRCDKILADIAEVSAATFEASDLKKLFRAMEKTVMKLDTDPTLGRADNVRWRVVLWKVCVYMLRFPPCSVPSLRASFDPFRSQSVQSACSSSTLPFIPYSQY